MREQLRIPKKIKAGFQKRSDTYSKKLAFVVWYDDKGQLKQEKSWNGWRDQSIDAIDYDNEPMSGFVLNRDVGGSQRSYGWNSRREKVRVYDPRDFEIEITVDNLLYILQECSSIKGKGLEGEFVYAWSGSAIVLLPVNSDVYKQSIEFTDLQNKGVTKADMIPGCTYTMKDQTEVMFLGRHPWYGHHYSYKYDREEYKSVRKNIFLVMDNKKKKRYLDETGFKRIAVRTSDKPVDGFSDEYEAFMNTWHVSPPEKLVFKKFTKKELEDKKKDCYWNVGYVKYEDNRYISVQKNWNSEEFIPHTEVVLKDKIVGRIQRPYTEFRKDIVWEDLGKVSVQCENGSTFPV